MACTNSIAYRYMLPSIATRVGAKSTKMAYENWIDTEMYTELAPPPLKGLVWILGKCYSLPQDNESLEADIKSRIWFSYRKNFRQIGDTSYRSDSGWGCTLRCGQMMLAHTLTLRHIGREWRYDPNNRDDNYNKILRMFLDQRDSIYSIQMIALQGSDFGRTVGQWFGPNNVAQAIKRLVVHDQWSKIAVYIAMDMLVIIEDMKDLCRKSHGVHNSVNVEVTTVDGVKVHTPNTHGVKGFQLSISDPSLPGSKEPHHKMTGTKSVLPTQPHSKTKTRGISLSFSPNKIPTRVSRSYDPMADTSLINLTMEDFQRQFSGDSNLPNPKEEEEEVDYPSSPLSTFHPLLMFIPLRLGQEKFNMEYSAAVKACFTLPQSVGIIGGKPRHALWFIGYHDNHLLYFDPHTTQPSVQVMENGWIPDESYHCEKADRILINELDPSLALGFYCKDENDLDDLCRRLQTDVLSKMSYMFELTQHRPSYWGPREAKRQSCKEPFILVEPDSVESDEGFELVDWPYPTPEPEQGNDI